MRTTSDFSDGPTVGWFAPPSPVVKRIMIICGVIFLTELLAGLTHNWWFFQDYVALSGQGIRSLMVWQLFTYMFLHDPNSILHILFNLLVLWLFGRDVELELGAYRFLKLYLMGGLVGGLCWLAFNFNSPTSVLGASGAVLAVCIAFATLYPERPITMLVFFVLPVTIKAKYWAWLTVLLVAWGCLAVSHSGVADLAHLGGIIVGYLYVKWLGYGPTPSWMAALRHVFSGGHRQALNRNDDFHSSRPGVAYNHPYRTFEEEDAESTARKKGVLSKILPARPKPAEADELDKDEYIRQEIDPILDKIAKQGMQSLSRHERKILEAAKDKIKRQ